MPNLWNYTGRIAKAVVDTLSPKNIADSFRAGYVGTFAPTTPQQENAMSQAGMNTGAPLSPGRPIDPMMPAKAPPREFQYQIGGNIAARPRSTEKINFDVIRQLLEGYDIAQMCIEVRQDELKNVEWDIVPVDEDDADLYESEIKKIRSFFMRPDGENDYSSWLKKIDYDRLAFDALSMWKERTRNGKLGVLQPVDGTTIVPLMDYYGRRPKGDAPAYMQWVNGIPWWWTKAKDFVYYLERPRTNTVYGFPAVEWLLLTINSDIRWQWYFIQQFTEGNVPEAFAMIPDIKDPQQIEDLQKYYDHLTRGDQSWQHRLKLFPGNTTFEFAKDKKQDLSIPEYLMKKACAGFKVQPAEIGMTDKVNKSSGETQENAQYRRSIVPSVRFYEALFSGIIADEFGLPNLRFKYVNIQELEDRLTLAKVDEIYMRNGAVSPDWVANHRLGIKVKPEEQVGRVFIFSNTAAKVQDALAVGAQPLNVQQGNAPHQLPSGKEDPNKPSPLAKADTTKDLRNWIPKRQGPCR